MNIKFQTVGIQNFMSIGEASINLCDRGYVLVSGVNNNPEDFARSNGSGKSSILEAVVWCLTGDTMRGSKSVVNKYTTEGTLVTLEFEIDGVSYQLVRSKDHVIHKTNLKIYVDGVDKSGKGIRDTEKLLKEYLPDLTASLIGSVIILGQGLPSRFTSNSPSGRKEVLEKLCRSDFMIQDLKDRITARKNELSLMLRQHEDAILAATTSHKLITESRSKDIALLEELKNISEEAFYDEIHELNALIDEYQTLVNDKKVSATVTEAAITTARNSLVELSEVKSLKRKEIDAKYLEPLRNVQQKASDCRGVKISLENELHRLDSIKDTCPTCGQRLEGVVKPDTSDLKARIAVQEQQYTSLTDEYDELNNKVYNEVLALDNEYNVDSTAIRLQLSQYEKEKFQLMDDLREAEIKLSSLQADLQASQIRQSTHKESILRLESSINDYDVKLKELDSSLLYERKVTDDLEVRLGIINKFNTAIARDFRGHLLSTVIEYINERAQEYSKDIFETDNIQFELEGNNISISYCGKEYEALSGGERQKVDLIIQFSIRDMLCSYTGFSTNIIALDEIFDNLDDVGCGRVIDLISKKLSDVSSIFIITHHGAELSIPCDSEIVIVKEPNGVSRLQ